MQLGWATFCAERKSFSKEVQKKVDRLEKVCYSIRANKAGNPLPHRLGLFSKAVNIHQPFPSGAVACNCV